MEPQVHEQEQKHPLPLWMRWLIVCFVPLLIAGGTILWIIQGAQAIIPIIVFTALVTSLPSSSSCHRFSLPVSIRLRHKLTLHLKSY